MRTRHRKNSVNGLNITIKAFLVAGLMTTMLFTIGCAVNVRGKQRPLVKSERIKGELRLYSQKDDEERTSLGRKLKSESTIMREELNLSTYGDVFDPLLMTYAAGLGLGLNQQEFDSEAGSGDYSGRMSNYLLDMNYFSAKAYPFSINMARNESFMSRGFQSPLHLENTTAGIRGKLRVPGWPMSYSWSRNDLEQTSDIGTIEDAYKRSSERFYYSVSHDFSEQSHFKFRTDHHDVSQESGSFSRDEKVQNYLFEHGYNFGDFNQHSLESYITYNKRASEFDSEVFDWNESLRLKHTPDFSTFYNANYSKNTFGDNESETLGGIVGLNHRLFDNFSTNASLFMSKSEFDSGNESEWHGGSVRFDYYKNNPWGRLSSYYYATLTNRDSSGSTGTDIVVNESHTFTDPLPIELDNSNIIIDSIVVTNSAGTDIYTEGLDGDYIVREIGDRVEIVVDMTDSDLPNISDGQELLVDYLYQVEGSVQEDAFVQNFRVEQKFNNGVTAYYLHKDRQSQIESDVSLVSRNREYQTDTFGLDYHYKNIILGAEHSNTESTDNSSVTDRLWAGASWPLTSRTMLSGRVSQAWIESTGRQARDTSLFRVEGKIRSRLSRNLSLTGRAEMRKEDSGDFGFTDGFRVGTALEYSRSALMVRVGWDYYYLNRRDIERATTMLYMRLIRRF